MSLLKKNLFNFCKKIEKSIGHRCFFKSVRKSKNYSDNIFLLNGIPVDPIVYTGIWVDEDSITDYRCDGEIYYDADGVIFMFVEYEGKFYVPDFSFSKMRNARHFMEDDSLYWACRTFWKNYYDVQYKNFQTFKFDTVIILHEL